MHSKTLYTVFSCQDHLTTGSVLSKPQLLRMLGIELVVRAVWTLIQISGNA